MQRLADIISACYSASWDEARFCSLPFSGSRGFCVLLSCGCCSVVAALAYDSDQVSILFGVLIGASHLAWMVVVWLWGVLVQARRLCAPVAFSYVIHAIFALFGAFWIGLGRDVWHR